jgi:hypothetical protein
MGGACGMHGEGETGTKIWSEHFKGREILLDFGVDDRKVKIYPMVWVQQWIFVNTAVNLRFLRK